MICCFGPWLHAVQKRGVVDRLAIGLWGCFFGVVAVILIGSGFAYARSLHRIAMNAALSALASALYATAYLGGLPIADEQVEAVILALVTLAVSALLTYQLFAILGFLRSEAMRQRAVVLLFTLLLVVLLVVLVSASFMTVRVLFILSTAAACLLGLVALGAAIQKALKGDRLAWAVMFAISCMLVALVSLSVIARDRQDSGWLIYAVSALAATLYMSTMAAVLWSRYAYLIEQHKLMAYGPSYDPVTRMRSHQETGHMVGEVFKSFRDKPQPLGIVTLTIANLYALEQLYGMHAVNHALFICAGRLRLTVPGHVEMGRLGKEGFVLVMPHCTESGRLIDLARAVQLRLRKPVSLNTSRELEAQGTLWAAEIGVGVLIVSNPEVRGSDAIATAYRMSRTAISYASRIAWFDHSSGETTELPDPRLL